MRIYYSPYDRLLDYRALARAFEKVRRAKGAHGIDGQTISDFQSGLREELTRLVSELRTKTYQPQPVRRVSIPKPDGGERHLGIPSVRDGNWEATELGSPQGGVVSPLIANIYLDAFDQELKRRGHRIVRYADDILILCRSEAGARHALRIATEILEGELKLTVNRDKTHLTHASEGVKFLGVIIGTVHTRIAAKKLAAFKAKVKQITRRNSPVNLEKVIADLKNGAITNGHLAELGLFDLASIETGVLPDVN